LEFLSGSSFKKKGIFESTSESFTISPTARASSRLAAVRDALRVLDIASLGNNAMPKLFDHLGKHHPDQDFIFDQEYGCLAEHFNGRLWSYRERFCSSRKPLAHPVHRPIIRFFTTVAKSRRRG
jgi:hypothetical protein